jgi:hypothetical protein
LTGLTGFGVEEFLTLQSSQSCLVLQEWATWFKRKTRLVAAFSENRIFGDCLAVRIEPELRSSAFSVGFGFTPGLLIGRFKSTQPTDFIENTFGVELALQPLERSIHRLAFSNNNFWHQFTSILGKFGPCSPGMGENLAGCFRGVKPPPKQSSPGFVWDDALRLRVARVVNLRTLG